MNQQKALKRLRSRRFRRLGVLMLLGVAGIIVWGATDLPEKCKRGLRRVIAGKPVTGRVSEDEIYRQVEARIRADLEEKYLSEIVGLRKSLADEERQNREATAPEAKPEVGDVMDVRELRSGIPFKSGVKIEAGGIASLERLDAASYTATYELSLRLPTAAKTLAELEKSSPELSKILPGLPKLVETATVSNWFNQLYQNKLVRVRRDANLLSELLTKHNIYDCETMLEFQSKCGRRVFVLQAEMDVVSDGSDGDRLPTMPDEIVNSANYQPFTSYAWPKKTPTPSPMVAGWERRIVGARKELEDPVTPAVRKAWLRDRIEYLKRGVADLKARSFLIAEYDPFIVIPVNILASKEAFAPDVGDYAVVIHGGKIYPAIVGDGGPAFKVGEGSLRLAREINPKASVYGRPVSDLKVSYLIFPGSRPSERAAPDFEKWRQRCHELVNEIGGLGEGYQLHPWQDLLPKSVPVAPADLTENPQPIRVPTPASGADAPAKAPE